MAGWNLSEGECSTAHIEENEIWGIINHIFSSKSHNTTSYKFCFLKCLLDNVFNVDENFTIDFNVLFFRFSEIYWNLVSKHKLCQIQANSQWTKSKVENVIENFLLKYSLDNDCPFEALSSDLQIEISQDIETQCSKNVIGAFFVDSRESFYSFSKKKKQIVFHQDVLRMFVKFKHVIEKLNYFEWVKFLEKVNPRESAYAIAEKLDYSTKRINLSTYRDYLFSVDIQQSCFYCGKPLSSNGIEVDHYIPWSFVKDDKLWNFVLCCRKCNNLKRDKLAVERYTDQIVKRNTRILRMSENSIIKIDFRGYNDNKILSMYRSAVFNGFESGWEPSNNEYCSKRIH